VAPDNSLRTFLRRFAVALVAVAVITTGVVVAANVIENNKLSSINKITLPAGVLAAGKPGAPANYLIVGSDSRTFATTPAEKKAFGSTGELGSGARSDVMMVVHLVPAQGTAFVVSFPRDTYVNIPGHDKNLLNAAFAFGGPALLIKTFQDDFGVPIQHYLAVNFIGFEKIVDAIGHVKIEFPTWARDFETGLYQGPGCNSLDGTQALAYARSRHYAIPKEGVTHPDPQNRDDWVEDPRADLDRIKRQQYFLRSLGQTALDRGASNLFTANRLADAVVHSLTGDSGLSNNDIKSLVRTFRGLDPATVEMTTLPVAQETTDGPLLPQYPQAKPVLDRLKDLSVPVALPHLAVPSTVRVVTVDASGVAGRATELQTKLTRRGFLDGGAGEASISNFPKTQVQYAPGKAVEGLTVALYLGTSNVAEAASTTFRLGDKKLNGDVIVVVGRDYPKLRGLLARPTSRPSTTVGSSSTTTTIEVPDTRYVPVSTNGLRPLVGCP
jgi:LCP family protein required for cell wall assembly